MSQDDGLQRELVGLPAAHRMSLLRLQPFADESAHSGRRLDRDDAGVYLAGRSHRDQVARWPELGAPRHSRSHPKSIPAASLDARRGHTVETRDSITDGRPSGPSRSSSCTGILFHQASQRRAAYLNRERPLLVPHVTKPLARHPSRHFEEFARAVDLLHVQVHPRDPVAGRRPT